MQHNFIALAFRKVVGLIKEHKDDEKVGVGSLSSLPKYGYHCSFWEENPQVAQNCGFVGQVPGRAKMPVIWLRNSISF